MSDLEHAPESAWRPSKQQLLAASGAKVDDVLKPGLSVVFCGINPGLYTGAVGHHFARPGNRFWRALAGSGFTDGVLSPFEDHRLLEFGIGLTNLVARVSATASELTRAELREGAAKLEDKLKLYRPGALAVLGLGAYRLAYGTKVAVGRQPLDLAGTPVWVLPNPSGLQARYQLPELIGYFSELRTSIAT